MIIAPRSKASWCIHSWPSSAKVSCVIGNSNVNSTGQIGWSLKVNIGARGWLEAFGKLKGLVFRIHASGLANQVPKLVHIFLNSASLS